MPAIFNLLKRNYGRDLLQSSRILVSCCVTIEKEYCHLKFNHACKREGVLPKSLRFLPPIKLRKGFQLVRRQKIPVLDIISGVDLGLSQVSFANKCSIDSTRCKEVEILKRAKPNLSKAEKRAMEELKQFDDIVILNADKGNSTVVMDKLEYDKKTFRVVI